MKKNFMILLAVMLGVALAAQSQNLKPGVRTSKAPMVKLLGNEPHNAAAIGKDMKINKPHMQKSTDVVSVISIGTSANAFGYGYGGGQKNLVNYNADLNVVTNFHRMGGALDPGGYSGDLGYDISIDGGITWTTMVECYVATENSGGQYYTDAARYPNHGLYNPAGNTDPTESYVTFFAPNLDASNEPDGFGGYSYGRAKVGDVDDTTKHLKASRPAESIFQYTPDGYCISGLGDVWVVDVSQDMTSGGTSANYGGFLIVNHGMWDEAEMDFVYEEILIEHDMLSSLTLPAFQDVEFAPDGLTGYILTLSDDGTVEISANQSYYPIIWRTEDGGQTWTDPLPVALAGAEGIGAVQDYLTDEEIAELFEAPVPDRDEIAFTTAFDCDLSVDKFGNPHIAVVCGVTGSDPYSIVSDIAESTGNYFTAMFLLSSMDKGEEGSWIGYELGRPMSFRGTFDTDFDEDNRIQISRDPAGEKMFVSWLDTDTSVAADNTAPDIWARGVDVVTHTITVDENGYDKPVNVTFGSEATFSAYFFAQSNEVIVGEGGTFTIPYVYENMTPNDPNQPVQFKYIQDFSFGEEDFVIAGLNDELTSTPNETKVSQVFPNPAGSNVHFYLNLQKETILQLKLLNLMGQETHEIPDALMFPGSNTVDLNISSLTPGIYFLLVTAEQETITRKIIIE
ncbi:MAG: T9SS type A sorting domain-containing protein [Bacteroidales bacterium]|nr:T9SS type A sorting domain-containing protein [Bacteroidales bacterium]